MSSATFKTEYNTLVEIGDRLQVGSLKLQALWTEAESEGWTPERVERWQKMDARYRDLIWQGWLTWGRAAVCFHQLPASFQEKVRAKLGYIGSYEAGWHELGIKTFLRHPEIKQVASLRREWNIREAIGEFD